MLNQPGQVKLSLLLLHLALCQSTSGLCLHPHTFLTRSSRHVLRNCSSQIPRGAFPVLHSPLTAVTIPAQAATPAHTAAEGHEPIFIFIPPFQTFHDQSASKKSICTPATELQPQKAGLSPPAQDKVPHLGHRDAAVTPNTPALHKDQLFPTALPNQLPWLEIVLTNAACRE